MEYSSISLQKYRFISSVSMLYALTLLFGWFIFQPAPFFINPKYGTVSAIVQKPHIPTSPSKIIVAGKPIRIVVPDSGIDLPIDEGYYSEADKSWTLSGYHAQFAMMSTFANDDAGDTFVYGHNNNSVFGPLRHNTPAVGAKALIYTDNNHVFSYTFQSTSNLDPTDTSVLEYKGTPMLTIQTCTGSVDEWRTLYRFKFDRVV